MIKLHENFEDSFNDNEENYTEIFNKSDEEKIKERKYVYTSFFMKGFVDENNMVQQLSSETLMMHKNSWYIPIGGIDWIPSTEQKKEYAGTIFEQPFFMSFTKFPYKFIPADDCDLSKLKIHVDSIDWDRYHKNRNNFTYIESIEGLPDNINELGFDLKRYDIVKSLTGAPTHLNKVKIDEMHMVSQTLNWLKDTIFTNVNTVEIPEDSDGFHINSWAVQELERESDYYGFSGPSYKKGDKYTECRRISNNTSLELATNFTRNYKTFTNLFIDLLKSINISKLEKNQYIQVNFGLKNDFVEKGYCHIYNVGNTPVLCINWYQDASKKSVKDKSSKCVYYVRGDYYSNDTGYYYSLYEHCYILKDNKLEEVKPNFLEGKLYPKSNPLDYDFTNESLYIPFADLIDE